MISICAVYFLSKYMQLGDYGRYINYNNFDGNYTSSTQITTLIFGSLNLILGELLSLVVLSIISSYLIISLTFQLVNQKKWHLIIFTVTCFPSIAIWTQIPGKEYIINLLLLLLIKILFKKNNMKYLSLKYLYSYCILFYKPHWFPIIIWTLVMGLRNKVVISLLLLPIIGFLLYIYYDFVRQFFILINDLAIGLPQHFVSDDSSTRVHYFWTRDWEWLQSLPVGSIISFIGPTPVEALTSPLHFIVLAESILITVFICLLMYSLMIRDYFKLNFVNFYKITLLIAIVLMVNYPFGYFNPGSALRYRSGYLLGLIFYLLSYKHRTLEKRAL